MRHILSTRTLSWLGSAELMPYLLPKVRRVGVALRTCLSAAQELTSNPILYRVGEALAHYLEEGLLLADVHANNIGLDDEGEAIITDPGHIVEFNPRWAKSPQVERL